MICQECSAENRPDRKFCSQCGIELVLACQDCGARNFPGERYCGECGTVLVDDAPDRLQPAPPETERRLVSVLFADLVGFTPFSEDRDPEEVRDFLSRYFEEARTVVQRFGGTVEKFIGDAVMAVWGAEQAREDDAERAVRAGLDLVEAVGKLGAEAGVPGLALRAGVLTGDAAVGPGQEGQGLVMGDLVNTASRVQTLADPGEVLVGEATYRTTNRSIAYEDLGERRVEGKEQPIHLYRAGELLAMRGGQGRAEALEPPFVGRTEELRMLKDLLHATGREGRSRLVSILGIAGIGKSRLVWEFKKYVDGLVEDVYWHEGRSPAYGEGVTFWALGEMVRRRAGIAETDDQGEAATKLRSALEDHVPEERERRWLAPRLGALLGLQGAPSGDREELFAAFRTFFEQISERGTTVLVFEDFQWADAGLVDFVEELPDRWRARSILAITLARPELQERRPGWGAGRRHVVSAHLGPLAESEMDELVAGMAPGLPDRVAERILERAAGVPLYAVELVRMLVLEGDLVREDGAYRLVREPEELAVPDSLVSVIGARLDRLEPEARALVQDAAVLGQTFTTQALEALTGTRVEELEPVLTDLVRKELLRFVTDPRSPEQGQYGFVQSLIGEVAHDRLGREERKTRHLAAARYFESLDDDELAPVVASHYVEAYRATTDRAEAEELAARARTALGQAAERAASLHSHEQALALCRQALTVPGEPEDRAPIRERAAASALALARFEEAEEDARSAIEQYGNLGDRAGLLRATRLLATVFMRSGYPDRSIDLLEELTGGEGRAADSDLAGVETDLARAYMLSGRYRKALGATERALEIAERLDLVSSIAEVLVTRGTLLGDRGRRREGTGIVEKGLSLAREFDLSGAEGRALANLGYLADDALESARWYEASMEFARRVGNREQELHSGTNLIESLIYLGRWQEAQALITEFLDGEVPQHRRFRLKGLTAVLEAFGGDLERAEALLREGERLTGGEADPQGRRNLEEARAFVTLAAGMAEEAFRVAMESARFDPIGHFGPVRVAGHAALWSGDREAMLQVLELIEEIHRRDRQVRAMQRSVEAGVAVTEGVEEALRLLDQAASLWQEVSMPLDLALVRAALARLADGHSGAEEARGEAIGVFEEFGAEAFLRQLE